MDEQKASKYLDSLQSFFYEMAEEYGDLDQTWGLSERCIKVAKALLNGSDEEISTEMELLAYELDEFLD